MVASPPGSMERQGHPELRRPVISDGKEAPHKLPGVASTGRNVRFACLQIYCKCCYKFQICNDLPHLHACKLLICTRGKLGGKCSNGREAVRRKSVANPLQTNYFATSLHACKLNANTKFASDLHICKSVDYIKLANGL